MADTYTTNLNLTKPEPGAAEDTWGISLNADLDALDAIFSSSGTQINLNPNQINFADGKKAVFNSNLNIFSTGTSSYIEEVGTGDLYLKASNLYITDRENNQFMSMIDNGTGGTLSLKHLGSTVLTTTSSGIDVTGSITTDGLTTSADINFGDDDKALFGAGNDLKIYHSANNQSYIHEVGSGDLNILATNLKLQDAGGSTKVLVNSTGIDVTGTVTSDGLTVDGNINKNSNYNITQFYKADGSTRLAYILFRDDGANYIEYNDTNTQPLIFQNDNKKVLSLGSNSDIAFYDDTGSTQGLFWDASAEKLGLGTTSPSSYNSRGRNLVVNSASGNSGISIVASDTTSSSSIMFADGTGGTAGYRGYLEYSHTSDALLIGTAGSERGRIDASGNVMLGKTSVDAGATQGFEFRADLNDLLYLARAGNAITLNRLSSHGDIALFRKDGTTVGSLGIQSSGFYIDGEASHSGLRFASSGLVPRLNSADSDNTVNLGESGIRFKDLHLSGTINVGDGHTIGNDASDNLLIAGSSGENIIIDSADDIILDSDGGDVIFKDGGVEQARLKLGKFGIGTSSPSNILHIQSASATGAILNLETTHSGGIPIYSMKGAHSAQLRYQDENGNNQSRIDFLDGGDFNFIDATSGTSHMKISSSGKVGIGTTNPTAPLDVHGIVRVAENSNVAFYGGNYVRVFSDQSYGFRNSGGLTKALISMNGNSYFNGGNVGIGITNPAKQLHVYQPSGQTGFLLSRSNGLTGVNLQLQVDSSKVKIDSYGDLTFNTAGIGSGTGAGEKMRITAAGNLGIGTNAPASKLHVNGNVQVGVGNSKEAFIQATNSGRVASNPAYSFNGDVDTGMFNPSTDNTIAFATGGSERARFDSSGNFLVGKTAEGTATDGIELNRQDVIVATRNGDAPLILNRRTSDGDIAVFRKDNTAVGSIGTFGSDIYIGNNDSGLRFEYAGLNAVTPFDVNSLSASDGATDLGYSNSRFKNLYLSGTAYAQYFGSSADTNTLIQFAGSDDIRFRAGGTEQMRIKTTGVGIGTSSPDATLKVVSSSATTLGSWVRADNYGLRVSAGSTSSHYALRIANSSDATLATFNGDGNVGIGEVSPDGKLHIKGGTATGDASHVLFENTQGSKVFAIGGGASGVTNNNLFFRNVTDNTTPMVITDAGNVGIGISSPTRNLTVHGGSGNSIFALQNNSTGSAGGDGFQIQLVGKDIYQYNYDDGFMAFGTNNAERLRLISNGNFGVGTTAPSSKLTVAGDIELTTGDLKYTGGINWDIAHHGASQNIVFKTTPSGGSATEVMRIRHDGNIGIGTSSPDYPLSVTGAARFRVDSSSTVFGNHAASIRIQNKNTTDNNYAGITFDGSANTAGAIQFQYTDQSGSYGDIAFESRSASGYSEKMRITSAGRLGLGTASPSHKLTIEGTTSSTTTRVKTTTGNAIYRVSTNNSDFAIIGQGGSNRLDVYDNNGGTTRLSLDSSGRLGLGTSSPTEKMEISGGHLKVTNAGNANIYINANNANSEATIYFEEQDSVKARIAHDASNDSMVFTDGAFTDTMTLKGAKVGIGTTAPTSPLHVTGAAKVTGTITVGASHTLGDVGQTDDFIINSSEGNNLILKAGVDSDSLILKTTNTALTINPEGKITIEEETTINDGINLSLSGSVKGKVGVSGSQGNDIYIASGTTSSTGFGLRFLDYTVTNAVLPCRGDGSTVDDTLDLGNSGARFDDIYATNGTINTSDRNDKQDIQALTEAEQRVATACKGLIRRFKWQSAVTQKGDDARYHFGIIAQDLQDAFEAKGLDAGDYGMFISSTWTDDEGNEQTRLGVRYNELLAFIITTL